MDSPSTLSGWFGTTEWDWDDHSRGELTFTRSEGKFLCTEGMRGEITKPSEMTMRKEKKKTWRPLNGKRRYIDCGRKPGTIPTM